MNFKGAKTVAERNERKVIDALNDLEEVKMSADCNYDDLIKQFELIKKAAEQAITDITILR